MPRSNGPHRSRRYANIALLESIREVLREYGTLGVNEIARLVDKPVSTVQRALVDSHQFVKTPERKWELPTKDPIDLWPYDKFEVIKRLEDLTFVRELDDPRLIGEALATYREYSRLLERRAEWLFKKGQDLYRGFLDSDRRDV